jgi:chemotaxis protein CheD
VVNKFESLIQENYFLQPGFIFLPTKPTIVSTVLGSSVSVCLYDPKRRVGGMNHFQFPYIQDKRYATARYGNVATLNLIHMMLEEGSNIKHLEAQLLGGAYNPEIFPEDIGRDNIMIAKKILSKKQVRIVSEDVGGRIGRKIVFNTHTNEISVLKVQKLRKGDWYPYESYR